MPTNDIYKCRSCKRTGASVIKKTTGGRFTVDCYGCGAKRTTSDLRGTPRYEFLEEDPRDYYSSVEELDAADRRQR